MKDVQDGKNLVELKLDDLITQMNSIRSAKNNLSINLKPRLSCSYS
jgi:hypothetical protein